LATICLTQRYTHDMLADRFRVNLFGCFTLPLREPTLVWILWQRDLAQRYRGSYIGWGWTLLTPLLLLCVYVLIFQTVFSPRWSQRDDFVLQLFAGLMIVQIFAEVLSRSPRLIIDQPHLVKKVVFPLPLLGWITSLSALFLGTIYLFFFLSAAALWHGLSWYALVAPLVLWLCLPMLLAAAWLFAALGTFVKDLQQVAGPLITLLSFLGPVFYPISALPSWLGAWVWFNPVTVPIESLRACVLLAQAPNWALLGAYAVVGGVLAAFSGFHFLRVQARFADVL